MSIVCRLWDQNYMKYDQWKINMDFILCVNVFVHSRPFIQEMFKKKKKEEKSPVYFREQGAFN